MFCIQLTHLSPLRLTENLLLTRRSLKPNPEDNPAKVHKSNKTKSFIVL